MNRHAGLTTISREEGSDAMPIMWGPVSPEEKERRKTQDSLNDALGAHAWTHAVFSVNKGGVDVTVKHLTEQQARLLIRLLKEQVFTS